MPRRFFKKFALKRERFRDRWFLAPFAHLLHDPNLWGIRRRTVVPAFAIGLFCSYLPFPGHLLGATLLALYFRVNIPVAALSTLVVNPLTIGPAYYLAYKIGQELLGIEEQPFNFELSLEWMGTQFAAVWQPLVLGSLIMSSVLAMIGYVALDLIWRASLADYLAKRRRRAGREE